MVFDQRKGQRLTAPRGQDVSTERPLTPWGSRSRRSRPQVMQPTAGPSRSLPLLRPEPLHQQHPPPTANRQTQNTVRYRKRVGVQSETQSAFRPVSAVRGRCSTSNYELSLGGGTIVTPVTRGERPSSKHSYQGIQSRRGLSQDTPGMVSVHPKYNALSTSTSNLSLLEQKKIQWAKEREELSGLWSPWGHREGSKGHPSGGGGDAIISPSVIITQPHGEVYLPPINSPHGGGGRERSQSTATECPAAQLLAQRKYSSDVQNNNEKKVLSGGHISANGQRYIHPQDPKHKSGSGGPQSLTAEQKFTYNRQGNAEWITLHNNNNRNESAGAGDSVKEEPRVIVHKIYMDHSEEATRRAEIQARMTQSQTNPPTDTSYPQYSSMGGGGDGSGGSLNRGFYGGSSGYLHQTNLHKPPPVAMRSSLTIGLQHPHHSFQEVQKKEREEWLMELEKQREEQRMRKLVDKDEKRLRWGDRGVGVGHFWEPSDLMGGMARLPLTPRSRHSDMGDGHGDHGAGSGDSSSPPGWLQRSLTRMQSSQSQPDLYTHPSDIPLHVPPTAPNGGGRSALDLRQLVDNGPQYGQTSPSYDSEQRNFMRGQNVPIDPDERVEKERKMRANQEHLEAIKKQIEDRQRLQKEEKERERREEMEHERRMAQQRELERQRLEMEKRQRNPTAVSSMDTLTTEASESGSGIQIYESSKPPANILRQRGGRDQLNSPPAHESPLIPHQIIHEPDAYEVEIAMRQRQALLLNQRSESSSDFISPPNTSHSRQIDQCLMTDSDHLYERTLTPTKERRSKSMESAQREFGTQTEISDDQGMTTSDERKSRSRPPKKEEKPRWGANPVKKVYLKQSEKDPNYQQRLRRKQLQMTSDESDSNLPFHRIRGRKSPLKALHSTTTGGTSTSGNNSSGKNGGMRPLKKSFWSQPELNTSTGGEENIVNRNLGRITGGGRPSLSGGLNSVGVSEESSGFSSPSLTSNKRQRGGGGDMGAESSLPSSASLSYIPVYSKEFVPMHEFDETPINAGKIAPSLPSSFLSSRGPSDDKNFRRTSNPPIQQRRQVANDSDYMVPKSFRTPAPPPKKPAPNKKALPKQRRKPPPVSERDEFMSPSDETPRSRGEGQRRSESPPVPALAKKMSLGLRPDDGGRLSSLPPDLLSPVPTIPIGSIIDMEHLSSAPNSSTERSSLSSAEPKVDIDIAITHAGNPDLQRILSEFESTSEENILKLPEIISGRSDATDSSLQVQEDFIRSLISHREVQEQLSAREGELSEKGIIEFNIRLPSSWAPKSGRNNSSGRSGLGEKEYQDPILASERRKQTAKWLHSLSSEESTPRESLLTNLSSLKQGIKIQQQELLSSSSHLTTNR